MAGDRSLAFVMIGLIGSAIVWVGTSHGRDVKPAINAYALARKASVVRSVPAVRPNPSSSTNKAEKTRFADHRGLSPLE